MIGRNPNSRIFQANNSVEGQEPPRMTRAQREHELLASIGGYKMTRLAIEFHRVEPRSRALYGTPVQSGAPSHRGP